MNNDDNIDYNDYNDHNERLYPDSESDNDNDIDNNDNQDAAINNINPDHELEQALQLSLQEYKDSQKRIGDAYNNIIHTNDEYLKSVILESLTPTELEYVLNMVEKFNTNTQNRLLLEQQQLEYNQSLIVDIKKKTNTESPQSPDSTESTEVKVLNKDALRNERLKFFYKK
jgi:hypothetical protein